MDFTQNKKIKKYFLETGIFSKIENKLVHKVEKFLNSSKSIHEFYQQYSQNQT